MGESPFSSVQRPLNHDAQSLVMSTEPHELLVAQNGISGRVAGSHAVESPASPAPLEKAGIKSSFAVESPASSVPLEKASIESSFDGFRAEGSPTTLEQVGCLLETLAKAEYLFSEGSSAGEPLISLGKAEIEGDRASKGLVFSNYVLNTSRIGYSGWRRRWSGCLCKRYSGDRHLPPS